jgi:hypothetical protein
MIGKCTWYREYKMAMIAYSVQVPVFQFCHTASWIFFKLIIATRHDFAPRGLNGFQPQFIFLQVSVASSLYNQRQWKLYRSFEIVSKQLYYYFHDFWTEIGLRVAPTRDVSEMWQCRKDRDGDYHLMDFHNSKKILLYSIVPRVHIHHRDEENWGRID